jgi:hypothetical protein
MLPLPSLGRGNINKAGQGQIPEIHLQQLIGEKPIFLYKKWD